jgi:succinyl-CoA synthetase beta subunit
MDWLDHARQQIERILTEHTVVPYSHGEIRLERVFDRTSDHYLVMLAGWNGLERVHGCLIHVDIIDGQVWVQRDGTEYGVGRELLDAGVPADRIVLAWKPFEDGVPFTAAMAS